MGILTVPLPQDISSWLPRQRFHLLTPKPHIAGVEMPEGKQHRHSLRVLGYAALAIAAVQALAPILWVLMGSFKTKADFFEHPWGLPRAWLLRNYSDAFVGARMGDYVWNSLTVVTLGLAILLFTAATTAYALVRLRFPGQRAVVALILVTMMVPPDVLTVPIFIVLRDLGLLGSLGGLACLYAANGFGVSVFLLRSYFMNIPLELEEAAHLEGLGVLGILWHVILPMALPGFASVAVIQGMAMWNDLYLAFVFLRDPADATVPIGLLNFFQRESIDWPRLLAALSATTVPVLIIYALVQRRFVEGLTAGAVK
jgi:raffinose/stachyose/melibiose transport system permease protein